MTRDFNFPERNRRRGEKRNWCWLGIAPRLSRGAGGRARGMSYGTGETPPLCRWLWRWPIPVAQPLREENDFSVQPLQGERLQRIVNHVEMRSDPNQLAERQSYISGSEVGVT